MRPDARLMAKGEIQSLEISFFVHATEDESKVIEVIHSQLSIRDSPAMEVLEGYFGNRIVRVKYNVKGEEATRLFVHISSLISSQEKSRILGEIERNLDEHSALYLRFSKQELMARRLVLFENDPVRVKVKPRAYLMRGDPGVFYGRIMGVSF